MTDPNTEEKLDNIVRWTITLPISLSIKVDIDRKGTNHSKSSWIKEAIEEKLGLSKKEPNINLNLKEIKNDLDEIKSIIKNRK